LSKNSDFTLDKEKLTIEETTASSMDQIVPNGEHVSNDDIAEQETSSTRGQDERKSAGFAKTGLTGPSGNFGSSPKTKKKERQSFEKLLAKYKKKGAAQRQKSQPNEVKSVKSSPKPQEQPDSFPHQSNCAAAPYSLVGSVTP
jgi:hypothetical protein